MLDSGGSLVAQMLEQDVGKLAAGAAAQRIQDRLVLAHGLTPALPLAGEIGGVADAADPACKAGIGSAQGLVARSRDDALVDALVDGEIAVHVAIEIVAVHLVVQPLDRSDFLVGDGFAGEAPGEAFEARHYVEKLLQVPLAELAHPRAAVGQELDQALRRQHLERLAQRRPGDPKHLAELPLGNTRAARNVAFHYIVAQPQQDLPVQRGLLAIGLGDWHPAFRNRGFHLHNGSLRNLRRRRSKSNTRIWLKRQKMNAKYLKMQFGRFVMRQGRHFLQIPGPSPVPDRILRAMDMPVIDHRSAQFSELGRAVLEGSQKIFQASGPVVIFPSSGTGAWEAAIVNTLSPGDKVLMVETGHFATLWRQMAGRFGIDVDFLAGDWRRGADPAQIEARLAEDSAH